NGDLARSGAKLVPNWSQPPRPVLRVTRSGGPSRAFRGWPKGTTPPRPARRPGRAARLRGGEQTPRLDAGPGGGRVNQNPPPVGGRYGRADSGSGRARSLVLPLVLRVRLREIRDLGDRAKPPFLARRPVRLRVGVQNRHRLGVHEAHDDDRPSQGL